MSKVEGTMGDEKTGAGAPPEQEEAPGSATGQGGAAEDLAQGLELMLRAARKAVRNIEPSRLEALGRRAMQSIETLDARKVGQIGRNAVKNLDPKRIEEIAEDAGRELLGVVERVAERVESAVSGGARASHGGSDEDAAPEQPSGDEPERPRVRVDDKG
jgi:hypothetical protein